MEGSWALERRRRERREEDRSEMRAPSAPDPRHVTLLVPRGLAEEFVKETLEAGSTRAAGQLARLLRAAVRGQGTPGDGARPNGETPR